MTYNSKIDVYILAAISLAVVVFLLGEYWTAGPILLILLLCAYPEMYQTTAAGLAAKTALGRRFIPYSAIRFVGPRAGRVVIEYGSGCEILIAPANRDAFLSDMANRTPHLIKRGQRLVAAFA